MIFNSWAFILFILIFLPLYTWSPDRWRRGLLIGAGVIFYGWWDERFLVLLGLSTLFNFWMGLKLSEVPSGLSRKRWLRGGVAVNLAGLALFKYSTPIFPNILLPIGISFYTFQAIAYLVEVERGRFTPTREFTLFFLYKCFFPQLVAGPIERPGQLLPQLQKLPRASREQFTQGLSLIIWGYFLKMVVADNLALIVNQAFSRHDYEGMNGFHVATAVVAFSFQIYGDFAGYSKIARGLGKLLGIELVENFNHPYLAKTPAEFWKRWHISLSSWLRDYLYIPLGGNRLGRGRTWLNLTLTMLLGGLWHGGSWVFVIWGGYHGLLLILYRVLPLWVRSRTLMFLWVSYGWLIFRAESVSQWLLYSKMLVSPWEIPALTLAGEYPSNLAGIHLFWIVIFGGSVIAVDLLQEYRKDVVFRPWVRGVGWAILILVLILFGASSESFIYFQF